MTNKLAEFPTLVSIITPVFNAAKFLPRLFDSVRSQREIRFEHILVDDCSTDDSLKIMLELKEGNPSIKIMALKKNCGPVVARNLAISEAQGQYLAFLDADDFWLAEKLLIQTKFMQETGAALSFTDYRFISEDGLFVGRRVHGANKIGWVKHHMTRYLGCLTIMVSRERCPNFIFPDISPSYRAEDFLAWGTVISQHGAALRCPHDLARYAVVAGSRSSGAIRAAKSVWKLYRVTEKIPLFEAGLYFSVYCILTIHKRWWCRPRWQSGKIDGELAKDYLLKGRMND